MKKKKLIGLLVSVALILPTFSIRADEAIVSTQENNEPVTDGTTTDLQQEVVQPETAISEVAEVQEEPTTDEVTEKEANEEAVLESDHKLEVEIQHPVTQVAAIGIDNETTLIQELANAQGDVVLEIVGGSVINLTKPLVIDTSKITSLSIQSTNDSPVILNHANAQRHFTTSGTGVLDLSFSNVVLSTDGDYGLTMGGIAFSSNLQGNKISGLTAMNNPQVATGWNSGFLVFTGNGGSLDITNTTFINNGIESRNAVSSALILIDTKNTDVNFDNIVFTNNKKANQSGGMISVYAQNGAITMNNITMNENEAASNSAGVFYTGSGTSTLSITNSHFKGNRNTEGMGGAINLRLKDASATTLSNTHIENNFADRGGSGINAVLETTNGLTLDTVTVDGNTASRHLYNPETGEQSGTSSSGGGIYVEQLRDLGYVTITNSTISNNIATSGGGFYIYTDFSGNTNVLIENSTITGNIADYHAGALNFNTYSNTETVGSIQINDTEITHNTVTGNDAGPGFYEGGYGGAIYYGNFEDSPRALKLNGVTFTDNKSEYPVEWSLSQRSDDTLSSIHHDSILNTTYSASQNAFMAAYDNAYNGDDIHVDYSAIVYFDPNPDMIPGLETLEYNQDLNYAFTILGQNIQEPLTPVIPGYRFVGWFDEAGMEWDFATRQVQEVHQYLHAQWEKIETYTVTFDLNGGTGIQPDVQTLESGSRVEEPVTPTRPGYTFQGWSLSKSDISTLWNFTTDTIAHENMVLYAQWTEIIVPVETATVTFDLNGGVGSFDLTQVLHLGSKVSKVMNPTRDGFEFMGWTLQKPTRILNYWNFDTDLVNGDIVLVAQWKAITEEPEVPSEPEIPSVPETPKAPESSNTLPQTGVNASSVIIYGTGIVMLGLAMLMFSKRRQAKQ